MRSSVAVVIPTHNRAAFLPRALGCVFAQRGVRVELHVVVDGATDGTLDLLRPLAPRLSVHHLPEALGVARARNRGLSAVRAPYVAFLDDDDLWAPNRLATMVAALEAHPAASFASAGALLFSDEHQVLATQSAPLGPIFPGLLEANSIPCGGSGIVGRTVALRATGGFDPSFHLFADWDQWLRLTDEGEHIGVPELLAGYQVHGGGMSHQAAAGFEELARFLEHHAARRAAHGITRPPADVLHWMIKNRWRAGQRRAALGELWAHGSWSLACRFFAGKLWGKTAHKVLHRERRLEGAMRLRAWITAAEAAYRRTIAAAGAPSTAQAGEAEG